MRNYVQQDNNYSVPKSEDISVVIKTLEAALPYAPINKSLDMGEGDIAEIGKECGTPHCHAGWYLVGKRVLKNQIKQKPSRINVIIESTKLLLRKETPYSRLIPRHNGSFNDGCKLILEDLKIENYIHFDHLFPISLWGNNRSIVIFSSPDAFTNNNRPNGAKNLQDIINHWKEFRSNVIAYEKAKEKEDLQKEQETNRKDITSDLAKLPVEEILDVKLQPEVI